MKTLVKLAYCSVLLLAGTAIAQGPAGQSGLVPLRIIKKEMPLFPPAVTQMGVREGMAQVAFGVDPAGRVEDIFVVACSLPQFGDATAAALKRWQFEPARLNGTPIAVATAVTVNFRTEGVTVVSLTANEHLLSLFIRAIQAGHGYAVRPSNELDRPPVPVTAPAPVYPEELAQTRSGSVTVQFYIDEEGKPRLPCASADDDPELAALAVSALNQWRFEAPTAGGRPARVKAVQVFNFRPQARVANTKG